MLRGEVAGGLIIVGSVGAVIFCLVIERPFGTIIIGVCHGYKRLIGKDSKEGRAATAANGERYKLNTKVLGSRKTGRQVGLMVVEEKGRMPTSGDIFASTRLLPTSALHALILAQINVQAHKKEPSPSTFFSPSIISD